MAAAPPSQPPLGDPVVRQVQAKQGGCGQEHGSKDDEVGVLEVATSQLFSVSWNSRGAFSP